MKKLLSMGVLALAVVGLLTGCGSKELTMSHQDIAKELYEGIKEEDKFPVQEIEITEENKTQFLGKNFKAKIKEGIASEPMMSSIAHSLVIVTLEDGEDVEQAKKDIESSLEGRDGLKAKWLCVEPETTWTETYGNTIIFVMTSEMYSANFEKNLENLK